jgi:uncharacterized cupredoxin-like copper-binding protein
LPLLLAIALLGAAVLVACGGDDDDDGGGTGGGTAAATAAASDEEAPINVTLTEWALEVDEEHAHGGEVTFNVANKGAVPHDLVVIRTDLAADALPTASGAVDETKVEIAGRSGVFTGGETKTVSIDLAAGSYVLICNVPAHYDLGMRIAFTVE